MRGLLLQFGLSASLILAPIGSAAATEVTVAELISSGEDYGGRLVTVEGEFVGDYGFRDDGWMWTQLDGDRYVRQPLREGGVPAGGNEGIGVRMPVDLGADLDDPGGYRRRGPLVRVTGIWKYHDPEEQGESYLEVETLEVLEPGRALTQDPNWPAVIGGILLLVTAAGLWVSRLRS